MYAYSSTTCISANTTVYSRQGYNHTCTVVYIHNRTGTLQRTQPFFFFYFIL